jgi:hypothetical protein
MTDGQICEIEPRVGAETWVIVDAKMGDTFGPEQVSGGTPHKTADCQPQKSNSGTIPTSVPTERCTAP